MIAQVRKEIEFRNGEKVITGKRVWFWCPGCDMHHAARVEGPEPRWGWNGSVDAPTFTPSLLVNGSAKPEELHPHTNSHRCHSYVTDGKIRFLNDCTHGLRGQTVPLGELP